MTAPSLAGSLMDIPNKQMECKNLSIAGVSGYEINLKSGTFAVLWRELGYGRTEWIAH